MVKQDGQGEEEVQRAQRTSLPHNNGAMPSVIITRKRTRSWAWKLRLWLWTFIGVDSDTTAVCKITWR